MIDMTVSEPEPFRIDDSGMPVSLGSALKVPSYAYQNWGIPEGAYRLESEDLYGVEWKGGSQKQMEYVKEAITSTGLGNFSQMLRDASANVVSHLVRTTKERINYLEPGAGVSTVNVVDRLIRDGVDMDRVFITMIEPSAERLQNAVEQLEKKGLRRGKHYADYSGKKDTDALALVGPRTQEIVAQVAEIHHHSYLDVPVMILAATLRQGGYFVSADWHNSMWEHPNRVYRYLEKEFDWKTKDRDLAAFCAMHPKAREPAPELSGPEEVGNAMIRKFWGKEGWAKVRSEAMASGQFQPCDDILMLEGHRPVGRYMEAAERVGLYPNLAGAQLVHDGVMPANPHALVDGSSILDLLVAKKCLL